MSTDPTNEERAQRIPPVLEVYARNLGDGPPDDSTLYDLIADLMHYASQNDVDFDHALRVARLHYEAEKGDCHEQ